VAKLAESTPEGPIDADGDEPVLSPETNGA
jgi:hypothetical protein